MHIYTVLYTSSEINLNEENMDSSLSFLKPKDNGIYLPKNYTFIADLW